MKRLVCLASLALTLISVRAAAPSLSPDLEREARWAKETLSALTFGEAFYIHQPSGHRFLSLWMPGKAAANSSGGAGTAPSATAKPCSALIVAHGRGWAPDVDLYGDLRVRLAEAGWATLSIQLPVLAGSESKLGDYMWIYPDAIDRFRQAVAWLKQRGCSRIGIVSHSLGATMANQYLMRTPDGEILAWVYIGIINGLEDAFRMKMPMLDIYAEHDWSVVIIGADERRKQIEKVKGSKQVVIRGAQHFYEDHREQLTEQIVAFLNGVMPAEGARK